MQSYHITLCAKMNHSFAWCSTAEFHDLATGANDAMSSLAVVMLVVEALSKMNEVPLTHQPLIFLANADEWGFAGSRRYTILFSPFRMDLNNHSLLFSDLSSKL